MAAGDASVVGLASLVRGQFVAWLGYVRRQFRSKHLGAREVVVSGPAPDPQAELAHRTLGAIDGNPVRGTNSGVQGDFAVDCPAPGRPFCGGPVVVTGDFGESPKGGAGVDGEDGVETTGVRAGRDDDLFAARRRPRVPDRVAAGLAGVVGLAGLLSTEPSGGKHHRLGKFGFDRLGVCEVVVGRGSVEQEFKRPLRPVPAVNRDPVRGSGYSFEFGLGNFREEAIGRES